MSDEKPRSGAGAPTPASGGPPKLERVPAGYKPPAVARPATPATPPPAAARPAPPPPAPPPPALPPPSPPSAGAPAPVTAPGASYGLSAREVGADAAIAAGIAHQGTLAGEGPLRLFGLAAVLQATGRLTLSPADGSYALHFRRGTVEHASSSEPGDDLGRFLVRRGLLTDAQLAKAETARGAASGDLVGALIAERLVNPAEVAGVLQDHRAGIVQRALGVEAGGWSWNPAAPTPPGAFPLGASFAMLCAAVRALDAAALLARLGDREHRAASRVGGRLRLEDLRLNPQEARAAGLFDGVRSPAELAAASPGDALALLRMALLLGEVDLLAFGGSTKGARAQAGAAPAPPPEAQVAAKAPPAASPQATKTGAAPAKPAAGAPPKPPPPAAPPKPAASAPRPAAPIPKPAASPAARAAPASLEKGALEALVKKLASADHFELLGVDRKAGTAQIKIAYFQLAKTYHPDAVPAEAPADVRKLCADVFAKVSEAWSVLGEDASRAAYLEALKSGGTESVDVMNIFEAEKTFEEGTVLVKARRYDEAIRKFDEAIRLNADEAEFDVWKAWCEFLLAGDKKTRLASAGAAIEAALKRNPRCAQGYLFLGQMAKLAGDLALAEKQLRRGLGVAPEHSDLQRELKYLRK